MPSVALWGHVSYTSPNGTVLLLVYLASWTISYLQPGLSFHCGPVVPFLVEWVGAIGLPSHQPTELPCGTLPTGKPGEADAGR